MPPISGSQHWFVTTARTLQDFKPHEKFKYAYPGVLEGNLTDCTWAIDQECVAPLDGDDCFKIRCQHIDYNCPPAGQDVCPHFTNVSCGWMPGTFKQYWMHKCNPLAVPSRTKVTFVTCKREPLASGAFQCYFTQVHCRCSLAALASSASTSASLVSV